MPTGGGAWEQPADDLARIRVELAERVANQLRLDELGVTVASGMDDVQSVLDDLVRAVVGIFEAAYGVIRIYDRSDDSLRVVANADLPDPYFELARRLERGEGACGMALESMAPVVVTDVVEDVRYAKWRELASRGRYRAVISTPMLTLSNELVGTMALYFTEPHPPEPQEVASLEAYARQAAEMIERANLHAGARQLAAMERQRSEQVRALADAALRLTATATVDDVLEITTEAARGILAVHQGVSTRLFGGWENASTYVSLSEKYEQYRTYDEVPKGLGVLNYVTRENKPLRLTGEELVLHPEWRGLRDTEGHPPLPDYLAAPFVARDGSNLGLIQLADKLDGTPFTEEDEAIVVQLAHMAAAALENLDLLDQERVLRERAEAAAERLRMLSDASARLARSLDLTDVVAAVIDSCVPTIAPWCSVQLLSPGGTIDMVGRRCSDPELEPAIVSVADRRKPLLEDEFGPGKVIRTGESELMQDVPVEVMASFATEDLSVEELLALGVQSYFSAPLVAVGKTVGGLTLAKFHGGRFDDDETRLIEDLAQRAGVAIDNASRYKAERHAASVLQRSLLPGIRPNGTAHDAAARYLPGASGAEVGGDWYDMIDLESGGVAMVVGDVMGRGIRAASVMSQVRTAVRAYLMEGHGPATVLRLVDRLTESLTDAQLVTCLVAVFDATDWTVCMASAGHLRPLLVHEDGSAAYVPVVSGPPLGVARGEFDEHALDLPESAALILFTDGLVEGPELPVDLGLDLLRQSAASAPFQGAGELCNRLLADMGREGDHDDDTALLAVTFSRRRQAEPRRYERLELAAQPQSVRHARSFVGAQLDDAGLSVDACQTAMLLVSEVVTNAVRHGAGPIELEVSSGPGVVRVAVSDGSTDRPEPQRADDLDEGGRGLFMVEAMAQRWGYDPLPLGKRVWFEIDPGAMPDG